MIDCIHTLTHVFFKTEGGKRVMKFEQIKDCSWNHNEKIRQEAKAEKKESITKIRIALANQEKTPQIAVGDYMINAAVDTSRLITPADIERLGTQKSKITEVVYNTNCQPYSQHIRLTGD